MTMSKTLEPLPRAEAPAGTARNAGRGGLAIATAKVAFILFGFGQQALLPAILGKDGYGAISVPFAIAGIVNNVIVALSIQGVSRTVSGAPEAEADTSFRRTLVYHAIVAAAVALVFGASAGLIARLESAPHVAPALRVMAGVVFLYGIYAPLVGALNGKRKFGAQAGLDILYGGIRFAAVVGGAFVATRVLHASGVMGGVVGFVLAAALIVPVAITRSGVGRAGGSTPTARSYFGFLAPLAFGLVSLNLLLQTDFLFFSHFAGEKAATAEAADGIRGVYRAFQLFSFLPYQLLMSVTFVLFPLLAKAHAERDREAVKRYTETGMRLALVLVGLFVGIVAAIPYPLLRFAFKDPSIAELGASAQPIHALGMGAFALLGVATTALTSLGRERVAALLTTAGVVFVASACAILIPRAELGAPMLVASSTATLAALAVMACIGGAILHRTAGGLVSPKTITRVALATGGAILLGSRLPYAGRLCALPWAAVVATAYVLLLALLGEIGKRDLEVVRSITQRKPASKS